MSGALSQYWERGLDLSRFLQKIQPRDFLATGIAAGQPMNLLQELSNLPVIEELRFFTGLLAFPYPFLTHPQVFTTSGYYGPIERLLNEQGFNMAYQPLPFQGFETFVARQNPRVVLAMLSPMDDAGYFSFGTNAEAVFHPFLKAAQDPGRLAIAQINAKMPRIQGLEACGAHRIHVSQIDGFVESDSSLLELPTPETTPAEKLIAERVIALLRSGDTLQFGIGAVPNQVAEGLAQSSLDDFGIHSELISDGFLKLWEAGKISNRRKGCHEGLSLFSFALGSQKLYDFLDERNGFNQGRVRAAPASFLNDPHQIAKNANFVSINSALTLDLSGQACSEAIGERQYSGVGGQLSFLEGAFYSPGGRSILCLKSCVEKNGQRFSSIVNHLPPGSLVSTPRHYVQHVVTEYGAVDLFGLTDEERPEALIGIAHPDFRDELKEAAKTRNQLFYHRRSMA